MTLLETIMCLGLFIMVITTILLATLGVARQERENEESTLAQELLIAVASDLRLSLARADLAATGRSSHFRLAPLPLAGRLKAGSVTRAYLRADWAPARAGDEPAPGLEIYELEMHATQVPPAGSLLPVRLRLDLRTAGDKREASPLATLPVDFPPP